MLWCASGLYLLAAVKYYRAGQAGLALAFLSYAFANVGFIMELK